MKNLIPLRLDKLDLFYRKWYVLCLDSDITHLFISFFFLPWHLSQTFGWVLCLAVSRQIKYWSSWPYRINRTMHFMWLRQQTEHDNYRRIDSPKDEYDVDLCHPTSLKCIHPWFIIEQVRIFHQRVLIHSKGFIYCFFPNIIILYFS